MKRKTVLLIIIGMTCAVIGAYKDGYGAEKTSAWISYGKTGYGDYYYDKNSITNISPKIIKVVNKIKYSENGRERALKERKDNKMSIDGWETLDYTLSFNEFDCLKNTIKTTKVIDFNNKGEIIEDFDFTRAPTDKIMPDSINDSLLKIVCQNK